MNEQTKAEIRQYLIDNGAEMTRDRLHQDKLIRFIRSMGYEFQPVGRMFGLKTLYSHTLTPKNGEKMQCDGDFASYEDPKQSFYYNSVTALHNMWEDLQNRGLESQGIQLPLF